MVKYLQPQYDLSLEGSMRQVEDEQSLTNKPKRKYKKRVMDPEKKPVHLILRSKVGLSLSTVRDITKYLGEEAAMSRTSIDWGMTQAAAGCINLKQVKKVIKAKGKKGYFYTQVKMMGDSMQLVVKNKPTVTVIYLRKDRNGTIQSL